MPASDLRVLLFTLAVAGGATLAILPFGLAAGWLLGRYDFRGKAVVETVLSLPLVLPPTAVGVLLLQVLRPGGAFGRALGVLGVEVLFTWKAVVLASGVMAFPLLVRSVRTAFEGVSPRLLDVARTLGRGPLHVFARVAVPLAWRGILSGALLAFARALGEFGATILVAGNIPGRTQTAALAIFQYTQAGDDAAAMRMGLFVLVLAFAAMLATEGLARRRARELAR
jgi:molybdate transport system permease protein